MKALKFFAVAILATSVFAETIAVLDSKQIFTNSEAYQAITKLADTKYKSQKQKLEAQREEYTKAMSQLTKDKLTQKEEQYKKREADLFAQRDQLSKAQSEFTKTVMTDQNNQMKALFEKFQSVVDKYAKQKKIDLVLNKLVVISSNNDNLDITNEIEKRFAKVEQ